MNKARLHLIPVPLSGAISDQLSIESLDVARKLKFFVAERAKTARQFIKNIHHFSPQSEIEVIEIPQNNTKAFYLELLSKTFADQEIGLVSEAGLPCIADPGFELVSLAHELSIEVLPYAGPNSMMMALMASGLPAQSFCFHGYLPAKKEDLRHQLGQLAAQMKKSTATHLFMETPYRTKAMIEAVMHHISPEWKLCIASALGAADQKIATRKIKHWNATHWPDHEGKPSIFILSCN